MRQIIIALCFLASPALADDPTVPDPTLTPGAVLPVTANQVCEPGYSRSVRHVSGNTKHQVYMEYGVIRHVSGQYEVDHLISLELGGSNEIKNLWLQSYVTEPWNAHVKDKLENKLHQLVCSNQISLSDAQREISTNWIAAYEKYIGTQPEVSSLLTNDATADAYATAHSR